ncbi:MAG TPA: ATP-binding protein, partial [Chitinophagaceae bacterium]
VVNFWSTDQQGSHLDHSFSARLNERTTIAKTYQAWKEQKKSLVVDLHGEELKEWIQFAREEMGIAVKDDQIKDRRVHSLAFFSHGWILVTSHEPQSPDTIQILERFATVFNLTYRRFLDLQKAEAQANEVRIEIALERIRARALAMHKSDELMEVANVLREQMALLGQPELESSVVHLYEEDPDHILSWRSFRSTDPHSKIAYGHMAIPKNCCEVVREWLIKFYSDLKEYTIEISGAKQEEWYDILFKLAPDVVNSMLQENSIHEKRYYRFSKFSGGALLMVSKQEPSIEVIYLQKRAAVVFDLAYRRFSDLQKTEAQAREAQIEAALEKVRSRSLAMHKSDELQEVVNTVFERLQDLNIQMDSANIAIFKEGTRDYDYWIASHFQKRAASFHMPYTDLSLTRDLIADRESGKEFSTTAYSFEEKNEWFESAFKNTDFKFLSEERKQFILSAPAITVAIAFSKNTGVQINRYNSKLPTEGEAEILKRFSKVFEQAYIRFLDLEKAEAQGREAQIEAALERVRSSSLAMHKSDELKDVVKIVFENFRSLGLQNIDSVNINIFHEGSRDFDLWLAAPGQDYTTNFRLPYLDHPIANDFFNDVKKGETIHKGIYDHDLKNKYFEYMFEFSDNKHLPEERKELILSGRAYSVATGIAKHSSIFIHNYNGEKFSEETNGILVRFSKVFDQAYTRFLDLQKAEANAREAQIEAGLERVRAKAMAMHSSKDLAETLSVFYRELKSLSVVPIRCGVALIDKESRMAELTTMNTTGEGDSIEIIGKIKMTGHPVLDGVFEGWLVQKEYHAVLRGNQIKEYYQVLKPQIDYLDYSHDEAQFGYYFMFNEGDVYAWTEKELTEDELTIYRRFTTVISLTYKRYKDLQQAEAQAREAKIEAGLERVRSKTMAMHNSDDVTSATATMFTELDRLGIENMRCGIAHYLEDHKMEVWSVSNLADGKVVRGAGLLDTNSIPFWKLFYSTWQKKEDFLYYYIAGKEKEDYFKKINAVQNYLSQSIEELPDLSIQTYYFPEGSVWAFSLKPHTEDDKQVMKRFASVFSLTFRRYQDLQKAEAQARESQIEAGLERVRARTMAMHSSNDVGVATATMFTELEKLGIENLRGGITIIKPDQIQEVWSVTNIVDGRTVRAIGVFDMKLHPLWRALLEGKERKEEYLYYWMAGKDKEDYINILNATPNYLSQPIKEFPDVHVQCYFFGEGAVWTNSLQPHSEEDKQVMKKFASVFSLTFRRYQDLKKAEAQAREATIEAALEKVRGKAMAMHNSNDLSVTTSMIITELGKLGIKPIRCGVGIINKETHKGQLYTARFSPDGDSLSVVGWVLLEGHPVLENIYEKWVEGEDYFPELSGDSRKAYYEQLLAGLSVPIPDFKDEQIHYGHFFSFSVGCLYAWSEVKYNADEIKILKRFASIIDLTFRRYFELQKSETNAREAVKQAALDRVRAEIASMRTINDLDRITPLIWNELTVLGIPFIRCGVFIMDEDQQLIHTFLSTPDGKAIAAFHLPYDTPGNLRNVVSNWKQNKNYIDHWDETEFIQFADILVRGGALVSAEQYLKTIPKGGFYLHFLPFLQGMLYVGNTDQLKEEEIELIQHVADAFSTAYARYEDFNKLESAKQQVEKTLTDLKQAQTQLVQSEKMASLGEMTAGIAHEIQNPLNFVNNFSEVSKELLDEMKTELETGNTEDAKDIADDVIQNLEKINHHGKRADAIVKSMLQHSRSSSGKKEPTDINALADEYLRLAYHGLRAKDKSFNARFETAFDDSIGKINIISQDIGRVLVNLINNAFYAVSERKKQESNGYEPTVEVFTKKVDDKIEIKVKDNGNGIPQKVLDKIFQPFFTTKPTGQGTGLGLSLAYDIVTKGHGGELKVKTREGEGSEFIIQIPVSKTTES